MSVEEYKESVKKRRQERLRLLRKKQRMFTGSSSTRVSSLNREYFKSKEDNGWMSYSSIFEEKDNERQAFSSFPFLIQVMASFILIAGVYMVMSSENTEFRHAQEFIEEVMTREYNVEGVTAWYREKVGGNPVFLPEIIKRSKNGQNNQSDYVIPVSGGKVVTAFGQDQQGITVGTSASVSVEVVKDGWIIFTGEKDGLGHTVIIDHGNGEETWYGQLQNVRVQLHDWVEQGQVIGTTSVRESNGQGIFYFALKKDSHFINPLDVIQFD